MVGEDTRMYGNRMKSKYKQNLIDMKKFIDLNGRHDESQITSIKETKYGEEVLLCRPEKDDDIAIIRLILGNKDPSNHIRLLIKNDVMDIADIQVLKEEHFSKGYGTLLMKETIDLARKRGIKKIIGSLHTIDEENDKRQQNFYKKFGFTIDEGKLILEL